MRSAVGLAGALLCWTLVAGCNSPRPQGPDVILITVDTTRADHLGSYGYERPTSPRIDALAAEGTRFSRAFSHVPITLPSHTSIMTGTVPADHGVRNNGDYVVPEELETLAEIAHQAGYETAAFVSAFVLESRFGLNQGFTHFDDQFMQDWSEEDLRDRKLYSNMVVDRTADQTTARVIRWLESQAARRRSKPIFLWVHYYDPHQRWHPPPPFDQAFSGSLYDGEIAFMDSQIGLLFDKLREQGRWHNSVIALTADHGEGLGQHGEQTHAILAHDSTLHVPMILKAPRSRGFEPRVVDEPVSHVDLAPTLVELAGWPTSSQHGRSLTDLLEGRTRSVRADYFECLLPRLSFDWAPLFGLRQGQWKYIHGRQPLLFDLDQDPGEVHNLANRNPEMRQEMADNLFAYLAGFAGRTKNAATALDPEVRKQLEALGYAGGGGASVKSDLTPRTVTDRRDPASANALLSDYYVARAMTSRGRFAEAAALFRQILIPLDPNNVRFLSEIANLERVLGRKEEAREALIRAQALDPENVEVILDLAQLEADLGRFEAAEALLQAGRALAPDNLRAAYLAAWAAGQAGDAEEAVRRFDEVLGLDASHRDSLIGKTIELARLGRSAEAEQTLGVALAAQPFDPVLHYNSGLLQLQTDRRAEAFASFSKALELRPGYPRARLALALLGLDSDDPRAARRTLQQLSTLDSEPDVADTARKALGGP